MKKIHLLDDKPDSSGYVNDAKPQTSGFVRCKSFYRSDVMSKAVRHRHL